FSNPGPKTILVTINAVGSRPTGQLIESVDFNIVVAGGTNATSAAAGGTNATIPEFSTISIVVLAIAIVGIIIATARQGRFSFGQRM
ncbi:MAG: PEFG-CTERM sorting domain-containing protein, partial [Nitrososphaera sp.]